MANCLDIQIHGWLPFDIGNRFDAHVHKDTEREKQDAAVLRWLGIMNGPTFGLRISYENRRELPNSHGGRTTYYAFTISGVEALRIETIQRIAKEFAEGGALVTLARFRDVENESPFSELGVAMNVEQLALYRALASTPDAKSAAGLYRVVLP